MPVLCSMWFPSISPQCRSCAVVLALDALSYFGYPVAYFVSLLASPLGFPSVPGADVGALFSPLPWPTPTGFLPDACGSLLHTPPLCPPWARLTSPSHARPGSLTSASVSLPRSILRVLYQTRSLMRVIPQTCRPLRQILCRSVKNM